MFKKSYNLYSLFWGLNLGAVKLDGSNQAKLGDNIELLSDTTPVKSKVN
jgi:hypothetical protein